MNTRLQVEHPITERVTGVDLVKAQINVANNLPLAFKQEDLFQYGHSIECRIYAEDPDNNFMPCPGTIKHITEPQGLGLRTDGYVYEGYEIPIYYDPMITKLIVWAQNREEAVGRMKRALYEYKITGVKTSIPFLERIMEIPAFKNGQYNTHFIEQHSVELENLNTDQTGSSEDIAMFVAYLDYKEKLKAGLGTPSTSGQSVASPWKNYGIRNPNFQFQQ